MHRRVVHLPLLLFFLGGMTASEAGAADLIYSQDTGNLFDATSPTTNALVQAYSGAGQFKNDPQSQCYQDLGPIPVGTYTVEPIGDVTLGDGHVLKNALKLDPDPANQMCGRSGFYIHGESSNFPGWASEGCIIIKDLATRQLLGSAIAQGKNILEVRAHYGPSNSVRFRP